MFGKNKKDVGVQSTSGAADVQSTFVVHTMADDLAHGDGVTTPLEQKKQAPPKSEQVATPQEPSPFLKESSQTAPVVQPQQQKDPIRPTAAPTPKAQPQNTPQTTPAKEHKSGAGLAWVLFLLFLAIIGTLVWFVWQSGLADGLINRFVGPKTQVVTESDAADMMDANAISAQNTTNITMTHAYSHDAKFAQADTAIVVTPQVVSTDVTQKLKEIAGAQNGDAPLIVDVLSDGAPMSFALFAKRFLPNVSVNMLTTLDQPFQIYILSQGTQKRIGIHTYSSQPNQTRDAVRGAETTLLNGLAPLFLFTPISVQSAVFEDSDHGGVPIRFYNFTPDTTESVDYATHYDHVFFGTSRATMRTMMDMVFANDAVGQETEVVQVVAEEEAQPMQVAPITGAGPVEDAPASTTDNAQNLPPVDAPAGWQP